MIRHLIGHSPKNTKSIHSISIDLFCNFIPTKLLNCSHHLILNQLTEYINTTIDYHIQLTNNMYIDVPPMYGIVVIETVIYSMVMFWMGIQTGFARRKYGVKYPAAYENKEDSVFNRYQRAHQNAVENATAFYISLLIAGLHEPIGSAIAGAIYIFGRVIYNVKYYTNPNSRRQGMFYGTFLTQFDTT